MDRRSSRSHTSVSPKNCVNCPYFMMQVLFRLHRACRYKNILKSDPMLSCCKVLPWNMSSAPCEKPFHLRSSSTQPVITTLRKVTVANGMIPKICHVTHVLPHLSDLYTSGILK